MQDFVDTIPAAPDRVTACKSEACREGRRPCPCPQACQLTDAEFMRFHQRASLVLIGLLMIVAIVATAFVVL